MTEMPSIEEVRALERFIAQDGCASLLLTFQGILRSHEEMRATLSTPPADDVRRCSNPECPLDYAHDGPCAPKGWTPPADDVREALAQPPSDALIVDALTAFYGEERDGWSMGKVRRMRAALTAVAFEVRPHGTVTDAEVEWEYGAQHSQGVNVARNRAEAERWVEKFEARDHRLQRQARGRAKLLRRRKASEWEPVEAAREVHP